MLPGVAAAQVTESAKPAKPTSTEKPSAKSTAKNRTDRKKPADIATQADGLVKDALYYEIYGDKSERDRLLSQAREVAPELRPRQLAKRIGKAQRSLDENGGRRAIGREQQQARDYVAKRNESPDTAAGHLSLARWCESRGLNEQARAHYSNLLDFQPDNAEARSKLDFRRQNGVWVTEEEQRQIVEEAKQVAKSIETWSPVVARIRDGLQSSAERARKEAEQELTRIEDVNAIPVLERTLSAASENRAVKLINKLSDWRDPQATRSLARQSIYSPWEAVRQLAAHKLPGRPYEEYVPNLLDMLRSAVQVNSTVFRANGQLVLREFFVREGPNAWELLTIDTAYNREARVNGNGNDTLSAPSSICDKPRRIVKYKLPRKTTRRARSTIA